MSDNAIEVSGLSVRFGDVRVLRGVDIVVPRGSVAAVVGPSGCGKTTLLRTIAGLERAHDGEISIEGRLVAGRGVHVAPERRRVALVPQEGALFEHLDVRGNVAFGLGPRWRRERGADERVRELLAAVELADFADRAPSELSGGQRQRVALARALAPRPDVVVLDEPFSALDAALRTNLQVRVGHALRRSNTTALLVTHDANEAMAMADTMVVLGDGEVRQAGSAPEIYSFPVDSEVGGLFGELTEIPATARGRTATCALGTATLRTDADGPVVLLVRPTELTVRPGGAAPVIAARFHGDRVALTIDAQPCAPLRVDVPVPNAPEVGDRVFVELRGAVHAVDGASRSRTGSA